MLSQLDIKGSATHQLDHRIIHLGVQLGQIHVDVVMRARLAVHVECDPVLGELQRQGANGARLIDVGYLEVPRLRGPIGTDVEGNPLLLAVQEEGHLVLQHGKVDHEQGLDGYVQLATRSS